MTTLEKIRAEIAPIRDSWEKDCYHDEADALTLALQIIDKYAEQEQEDVEDDTPYDTWTILCDSCGSEIAFCPYCGTELKGGE